MRRGRRILLTLTALAALACVALGGAAWWLLDTESGLRWVAREASHYTGGQLVIEAPTGALGGALASPRVVYDDGETRVVIENLRTEWSPLAALARRVVIDSLDAERVTLTTTPSADPAKPPPAIALPVEIDVAQARIGTVIADGVILRDVQGGYTGGPQGHALRDARFDGDFGRVYVDRARIDAKAPYALDADLMLLNEHAAVRVLASGNLSDIVADFVALTDGAEAIGSAWVQPYAAQPLAAVSAFAQGVDPAAIDRTLPAAALDVSLEGAQRPDALLSGTLGVRNRAPGFAADGRLPVHALETRFRVAGETLTLDATRVDLGAAGEVTGRAQLAQDRGEADLAFKALDLRALHRTLRTTRLAGSAHVEYDGDVQRATARVSERGVALALDATRRGARVELRRAEATFGRSRAEGRGEITLAGNQPFSATVRFNELNPADFGDFPPALLNGDARATGRLLPQWSADVAVELANSRFRDAPLAGTFRGTVNATQARDAELAARWGDNTLRAAGTYGSKGGAATFQLDARRLALIEPRLGGRITAKGRVEGPPGDPAVSADIDAERIAWDGRSWAEKVRATVAGTLGAHAVTLDARVAGLPAKGRATGGWRDARWRGTVDALEVGGDYPFALEGAMPVEAGADDVLAGPGRAIFAGGRLDLESVQWRDRRLASRGGFAALPAAPFLKLANVTLHERTDLRFNGRWDVRASPALDGTVTLSHDSGDVVLPTDPPLPLGIRTLAVEAKLVNDAIDAVARLDSRVVGMQASASTGGVTPGAALKAQGTATLANLKPLESLVGTAAVIDGRVQLAFAAAGTLGQPVLTATLIGDDMRVDAPVYGVALRNGTLRASLADRVLRLEEFVATADRGRFVASGEMPLGGSEIEGRLQWRAEDLSLFNRPDRRLQVDGEGTLALAKGRLVLRGAMKADSAYFEFEPPPVARLDDDVIVRGRPREPRGERFRTQLLDVDIAFDFGPNFRILGAGLETQLVGKLAVRTAPDGALVGRGTVTSQRGSYFAFGQKLTIDRGQLIFDGPLENPSLDVLAIRKGLAVEAGVEVSGTVQVPRIRLVSNPPVPDAEKLTWLTLGTGPETVGGANLAVLQAAAATILAGGQKMPLGRQVAQAVGLDDISVRGTGAAGTQVAVFGKRLSDRVYVEYEQGVVAANFIVRLSYALSRFISASAETGRSTGVGVYYRRSFK
jgi:translocation and assembly module TamB